MDNDFSNLLNELGLLYRLDGLADMKTALNPKKRMK